MKKLFALLMTLAIVFSLCACGDGSAEAGNAATTEASSGASFMAGFGMVNVTPSDSVNMAGYGDHDTRLSDGYVSYLEARAVAIMDENGDKMLFIVVDTSFAYDVVGKDTITKIEKKLGIPEDHIVLCGTHTHNSVATWVTGNSATVQFNNKYVDGCIKAAEAAVEDLKPAEVYVGSAMTENLNFVRRYFMDDGSLIGDGTYGTGTTIVSHETEADREVQMVKFVREGGKDILITNFQAHPHLEGKLSSLSADTIGGMRDAIEKKLDVHSLHFQGAAGNLNSSSRIDGETQTKNRNEYGELFAGFVAKGYDSMTKVETGPIKITSMTYVGDANHSMDHLLVPASEVMGQFNAGMSIADCTKLAQELGLNSFYHARNIVNHAKKGKNYEMEISAFSFGDVAGIMVPYEMFDTSGMEIKENSPFAKTLIAGYAYPGHQGYVPTEDAWTRGGYEVETSNYGPGNAEKLVETYLGMLNDLKG
jgi:hypothetical protein